MLDKVKNIMILGSTGFIGSYLVKGLRKHYNVIGFGRRACLDIEDHQYRKISFSDTTTENFLHSLDSLSIDFIFHCISTNTPSENTENIDSEIFDNVLPTLRLMEAMTKSKKAKTIVFISSGGTVYGESSAPCNEDDKLAPICGYGMHKMITEQFLAFYERKYGVRCYTVRLSNPYGIISIQNRKQGIIPIFIDSLINQTPITLFGNTVRDYIYIEDVIDALEKFIKYDGRERVFNLGTGIGVSINELIRTIEEIADQRFKDIRRLPIRSCDVQKNILDISRIKRELEWKPRTDIRTGLSFIWKQLSQGVK